MVYIRSSTSIPLSRIKLFAFLAIGTLLIVADWNLFHLSEFEIASNKQFNNPPLVHCAGLTSMILSGFMTLWSVKKFDPTPGLVLKKEGLFKNTNMFSIGFVAWADVSSIQVNHIHKQGLIYVVLRASEKYISTCGPIKQILLRAALKLGPSPVTIISNSLTIGTNEVASLVLEYLSRHRNT